MPQSLSGRIALVTGASRGIGHSTALALAKAGAHVIAIARTVGGLEELDDAIKAAGGSATLVPLDLKDYEGIDRLGTSLNERYGRLDVLVANAGLHRDRHALQLSRQEVLELVTAWLMSDALLRKKMVGKRHPKTLWEATVWPRKITYWIFWASAASLMFAIEVAVLRFYNEEP